VTTNWNDNPTAPPVTDGDLCATWSAPGAAHAPHTTDEQPATGASTEPLVLGAPMPPPPPPRTSPSPARGGGARVALVGFVMLGLVGAGYVGRGLADTDNGASPVIPGGPVPVSLTTVEPSTPLLPGNAEEPVKAVARALGPSVVVIKTEEGLGSGVVYDPSGLIITNAHVVGTAKNVTVTLNDGRSVEGTVSGADAATDIAVVKIDAPNLSAARLAAQAPEVGDLVVALGSPFGLDQTITSGVVSAVNRAVDSGNGTTVNMLQTDAAINPGNSGGALANRKAEVVGINSMIYSETGANNGIGFAIPIARAKDIADHLVAGQKIEKASLGVSTKPATNGDAGAVVASVVAGSAAEKAGVQVGDEIVAVDGTAVKDPTQLAGAVAAHNPGDTVKLTVKRGGQQVDLSAALGTAKPSAADPSARGRTPKTLN
jgi:putative serine protease PepD